jgi:arginyl-tRNA synthetase
MHVGHLRSTIIGESTSRVLEFCGHEVHRLNHVGDWGTQFGMLIEYMKEKYPKFQEQLPDVSDLQEFYKASKRRFDEDDEFKKKAQLSVVDLQAGGEFARSAWQKICDVSRVAFEKIYSRLDIKIEERGESYYNSMIEPIVTELKKRKLCVESKGAMCIFTPRVAEIPLMAVKGDGGYGYDSTDLAAIYHRLFVMRADWVVYITDMGQELHFYMIFDAAMQAGWHRPPTTRCDHMGFGVVQGEDKKKFKTRSGDVVRLVDLFDEAVARAAEEIDKRVVEQEEKNTEVFLKTPEERAAAAEKIGIAAVRYFDMKQNRTSPYVFNYDKMLDPKGNSAVFLFYAYARIRAIQRKSGLDPDKLNTAELRIEHPAERALALKLLQFPDTVKAILAELHLHYLTDFLWELCGLMTQFYTQCHVLGEKEQTSRLLLCEATRKVLLKSFELLGFTPLERI